MTRPVPLLAVLVLAALPALAQGSPPRQGSGSPAAVRPEPAKPEAGKATEPAKPPKTREARLDELFERLKKAPDEDGAKPIVQAIELLWLRSGSDTVDLLMTRALEVSKADNDTALALFDSVVDLAPAYAEGWNRRATLYFLKKDYERSMLDIRNVLAHEPRHFNAWAGLGRILEDVGNPKRALQAYRRALALNPHLDAIKKTVDKLSIEVEGRDI